MTATIGEAVEADVSGLASLVAELGFPMTEGDIERRRRALAAFGQPALVARDDRVVGCLTWNVMTVLHRQSPVGRISMLVVASDHQSRGIGRSLVGEAEARMAALGCTLIEVTSNERLERAHRFYERLGYARTSLRFARRLEEQS